MKNSTISHPYKIDPQYKKPVAYFSMEYAIHQPLKIYASGLGYIAGSYLRSAFSLKQNVVGVGILWKNGFYDQVRKNDQTMEVLFHEKQYHFLQETNINFSVKINDKDVKVTAYYLPPEIFNTAPLYLLSTDLPENDFWSESITSKLYESNIELRTAAKILLGIGGLNLLEAMRHEPEVYHLNNADALPLAFFLLNKYKNIEEVKKRIVYTNSCLDEALVDKSGLYFLEKMNYFNGASFNVIKDITRSKSDSFDPNLAAHSFARISNGLSVAHTNLIKQNQKIDAQLNPTVNITIGQNFKYWEDTILYKALKDQKDNVLVKRKKANKKKLFEEIAEQTGEIFDENILTLVWARTFTSDRRPDLILQDNERFQQIISNKTFPIQLIFAGKPHPMDYAAVSSFDKLINSSKHHINFAVLVGHELKLAKLLKGGADLWLNTQRVNYEATETSGISAAMNGSINLSTPDGWINEFCKNGNNSFIVSHDDHEHSLNEEEKEDINNLFDMLEKTIIPMYYNEPSQWLEIMKNSMRDIIPYFDSDRMVKEYYEKLYNYDPEKVVHNPTLKSLIAL
jgi:starch phosphorylase